MAYFFNMDIIIRPLEVVELNHKMNDRSEFKVIEISFGLL